MEDPQGTLAHLIEQLRLARGDTAHIEVKAAAGGLSPSLTSTLCALSNLPGGGWIVLGLNESQGFAATGLANVAVLKQGLASKARACEPPVQLDVADEEINGEPVIIARVAECSPSQKPCRVAGSGKAWLRGWDGDYMMSPLEEQGFLANRTQPTFDREAVPNATYSDLDAELLELWFEASGQLDPRGLGRFTDLRERLYHGGVITNGEVPTRAGLLALGVHPQRFYPRFVVNLAVTGDGAARAQEARTLTGPIPTMLDGALDWAGRTFSSGVRAGSDGALRDVWSYPLEAFRELIGNALVHRDLDAWSEGEAVEVRLRGDKLVVTNPGGLYGITVDRLGQEGTTSARNAQLIEVCRYARAGDGARVVETLASGIPRIYETLHAEGHPDPDFFDSGLRFTAVLRPAQRAADTGHLGSVGREQAGSSPPLNPSQRVVLEALAMARVPVTVVDLAAQTQMKAPTIRKALRSLREAGRVTQLGGRGQRTTYKLAPSNE